MRIGIIIIFHNDEKKINTNSFIKYCNKAECIEFCLVNNHSKDDTYFVLKEIKAQCNNVSVVNIKKFKADNQAIKAGARYMFNHTNFNHIGYISMSILNETNGDLMTLLETINKNQNAIATYNAMVLSSREVKQTMFQKLFSVIDHLTQLNLENQYIESRLSGKY
ncbi:family 2 glycosyl transferase [uncultured Psychroserpens sp.]|uniref:family 2 glycosyl transferase n=1 Tax=uncultured Psychroserpens sp. TaxID=255436 RepID=UPI002620EBFC|nr:family 2 glycosyl transferase [uncultured Psychroserpens sp.]